LRETERPVPGFVARRLDHTRTAEAMAFPTPWSPIPRAIDGAWNIAATAAPARLPAVARPLAEFRRRRRVRDRPRDAAARVRRGVTHFDLANNYGPPYGSAEENFGRVLATDFAVAPRRAGDLDQGGLGHVAGPYGDVGGSQKYLIASCDQSLKRMGLDYVDIFYSHRVDPRTPLEETMGALAQLHAQGKALYVGISSYSPELTRKAAAILAEHKVPLLIHQPSYSMLNRWVEHGLLDTLGELGTAASPSRRSRRACSRRAIWAGYPRMRARRGAAPSRRSC
jgi:L-glyceraldehyde 3-phosphate reductase